MQISRLTYRLMANNIDKSRKKARVKHQDQETRQEKKRKRQYVNAV